MGVRARSIQSAVLSALEDTPAVFLHGPRQAGKTTLARGIAADLGWTYLSFDEQLPRAAASADPEGFLAGRPGSLVLDEVQLVPELARAIKAEVDRDRRPGRFLLTGSTDLRALPALAESLVGRMEVVPLWPFAASEIEAAPSDWVDRLFATADQRPSLPVTATDPSLLQRIAAGGFPEAVGRRDPARRLAWFDSYLTTILQREVRELTQVAEPEALFRLLQLLASRAGGLLNFADIARTVGMPQTTLKRYFGLLEATFLVRTLPAWSGNLGLRLLKSPKLFLVDTGLACALLGADPTRLKNDGGLRGALTENFAALEILKQASWSLTRPRLFHYRTAAGHEVDLVLENRAGQVVGVEVKASSRVESSDFRGLRRLRGLLGERFLRGVVLHGGRDGASFGDGLVALPMESLWRG